MVRRCGGRPGEVRAQPRPVDGAAAMSSSQLVRLDLLLLGAGAAVIGLGLGLCCAMNLLGDEWGLQSSSADAVRGGAGAGGGHRRSGELVGCAVIAAHCIYVRGQADRIGLDLRLDSSALPVLRVALPLPGGVTACESDGSGALAAYGLHVLAGGGGGAMGASSSASACMVEKEGAEAEAARAGAGRDGAGTVGGGSGVAGVSVTAVEVLVRPSRPWLFLLVAGLTCWPCCICVGLSLVLAGLFPAQCSRSAAPRMVPWPPLADSTKPVLTRPWRCCSQPEHVKVLAGRDR